MVFASEHARARSLGHAYMHTRKCARTRTSSHIRIRTQGQGDRKADGEKPAQHVPYRDSKLTRILKNSLQVSSHATWLHQVLVQASGGAGAS